VAGAGVADVAAGGVAGDGAGAGVCASAILGRRSNVTNESGTDAFTVKDLIGGPTVN
jgi:hypothetical protein